MLVLCSSPHGKNRDAKFYVRKILRLNHEMTTDKIAKAIVEIASKKNIVLVLAESCTGGLVAAALTDIAGSSAVLDRSLVTYSNDAKRDLLGVPNDTLITFGAVSAETASAMTKGALSHTPAANLAASVTGIAGPGGGSKEKPVGLVHFACQKRGHDPVLDRHIFIGDRNEIRKQALVNSLKMIYYQLY